MVAQQLVERQFGIEFNGGEILTGAGKISAEQAKLHAETEFEKFRIIQDRLYESDFDKFMKEDKDFDGLVEKVRAHE